MLKQAPQRHCRVYSRGGNQNLTGHSSGQPDLDPALSRKVGLDRLQRSFSNNCSVSPWF